MLTWRSARGAFLSQGEVRHSVIVVAYHFVAFDIRQREPEACFDPLPLL